MVNKPTYEELEQRVKEIEREAAHRKRAEEALRRTREKFRLTFENAVDAIYWADPNTGLITDCNKAAETLLEKKRDEIIGQHQTMLHPPQKAGHYSNMFRRHIESNGSVDDEAEVITKSGRIIPVHITASVTLVGGSPIIQGVFRDVTEHRRAEKALRESEERYRRITEAITDYIYTVRIQDGLPAETIHGPACVAVTGYTSEDFKKDPYLWIQMVHEEDREAVQEQTEQILSGVKAEPLEHRIVRKDGAIRWVRNSPVLQYDGEGKLASYDGLIRDITERKRAEEALRESETKYSMLAENSLTGIYIDQDEKIVFANNRFAEIYGYRREESIGIESWRLVHPEDRDLTSAIRAKRLKGEDAPSEYEARGLTKEGETIWITRRNRLIEYQGRPAVLGNIVDITEQKKAEEELRKKNEELNNFAHVVSHDLKTPIISIQGLCAWLLKNCQEHLGEKCRNYLLQIQASAGRMEVLVSDLLTLSTIGRVVSDFTDVSSLNLVRKVTEGLDATLNEKGIELAVAETLPEIRADGGRIYEVFENLIVNAIKYMGDTENPRIEVGYDDNGAFHRFYVKDNGVGIDPQYHQKIFELFHRLREVKGEPGTGLGLAIVERIVNNHGGRVWVESEKGKGAVFYFTLPKEAVREF
jgi:PAS domain S-box-containing protein